MLDWSGAKLFYRATADRLFRSFWGLFGWGHVPLAGFLHPYRILLVATAAGIVVGIAALYRNRSSIAWEAVLILGSALLFIWGVTFVRGASYIALPNPYFPVARYAYSAIIPTVLLLSVGWLVTLDWVGSWLRAPARLKHLVYLLFLVSLDLLAIFSIARYYRG
jgi:hypothetical protein